MAFNYERIRKKREGGGNEWTSYSDLFTCLAFLFLMMYVTVSLRTGTQSVQQRVKLAEKDQQIQDMRDEMRAYDSLKREYLEKGASTEEQKMYKRLMERLTLLQDQATKEKEDLKAKARDNEEKAIALNQYQKVIRNIINANMIAQARIKNKEDIIHEKEVKISDVSAQLHATNTQLKEKESELEETQTELDARESQLEKARASLKRKARETAELAERMKQAEQRYISEIDELRAEHERQQAEEKKRFQASLRKQKLSAESRLAKEREFRRRVEGQNRDYDKKLAELNDNLTDTQSKLAGATAEKGRLAAETKRLQGETEKLQGETARLTGEANKLAGDLKRTQAMANHKRELAKQIKANLVKAGVDAEVDPKSGDVTIAFGKEYFDTNEARLKPGMKRILEKFVPVYARTLFADPKIAKEIRSVELVGFASPTYNRRYVDPSSLAGQDRQAVNYNMDLSYQRAKSIFNYIFDTQKVRYDNQGRLLPLVKVTGRSYLASKKPGVRAPASAMNADDFCRIYNCLESQKVIIKFNLEE